MGLGAALVVGDGGWKGAGKEARACGRAVPYHSGTTGSMKAGATHGSPLVLSWIGPTWGVGPGSEYSTGVHIGSRGWCHRWGITLTLALSRPEGEGTGPRPARPVLLTYEPCCGAAWLICRYLGGREPRPRFLAEPRNDSVKKLGWDEGGRDGLAVHGHPRSTLRRCSGERPYPAEWHERKGWGEVLGSGLFYYEVSGEVGQDLGARLGYEDGIGVDYADLAVDFDVGDQVEDKAGFQGSLVVLDDAH